MSCLKIMNRGSSSSMASFRIVHQTSYRYTDKVVLDPHYFRLFPRLGTCCVDSHDFKVAPEPAGASSVLDAGGDRVMLAWFREACDLLEIRSELVVRVEPFNPLHFIFYPVSCARLPMVYPPEQAAALVPYMNREEISTLSDFAESLAADSNQDTLSFLTNLCRAVCNGFSYEQRNEGAAWAPAFTLKERKGCCRDFAVLAMALCRRMGIASRYVSGYYLNDDAAGPADLHSWVEVFLPGAGWRGFDPAQGVACDYHYLALSAAADPLQTMPVTGTFYGNASCRMLAVLTIDRLGIDYD